MLEPVGTNVRVAVRVRPLLPREIANGERECVTIIPEYKQIIVGPKRAFTFDYVFGPETSQRDVYEQAALPLVQSCVDGYNAAILAYGQTG